MVQLLRIAVLSVGVLATVAEVEGRQGVRGFPIDDVIAASELIIVGRLGSAQEAGSGTVAVPGRGFWEGRIVNAEVNVTHWIKGAPRAGGLRLRYVKLDAPIGQPWPSLAVYFLRSVGDHYEFVDLMTPTVLAAGEPEGDSILERVVSVVAGVISAPSVIEHKRPPGSESGLIQTAVTALSQISTDSARRAIRGVMRSRDRDLQLYAAGQLVRRGDPLALEFAANALEQPGALSAQEAGRLWGQLGGGSVGEDGFPAIARLLKSKVVEIRLAAVSALCNGSSPAAIPLLAQAVSDSDADVKSRSMNQLAVLTGSGVRVASNAPAAKLQEAEAYWTNWARERGLGR